MMNHPSIPVDQEGTRVTGTQPDAESRRMWLGESEGPLLLMSGIKRSVVIGVFYLRKRQFFNESYIYIYLGLFGLYK